MTRLASEKDGERGVIILLMAVAIVGLIGAASLAIDIGSALVTKAELQNVADASSLAATRELGLIYKGLGNNTSYKDYTLTTTNVATIKAKAQSFANANKAGGVAITLNSADVVMGPYDGKTGVITPGTKGVRAVEVTSRRDDTQNGQLQTQLARVLGIDQIAVTAQSASGLSALGTLKSGKGEFPVGLDEDWFSSHNCGSADKVIFYPTSPGSCAGWHTFNIKPASAARLKTIVNGIGDGTFQSPETVAGQTYYEFTGGVNASVFPDLKTLFESKRSPSDATGTWTVNVPVYKSSGCSNPNQSILIVGFARLKIMTVTDAPSKLIDGDVECGIFNEEDFGAGGGEKDFGTLVGTPDMIH